MTRMHEDRLAMARQILFFRIEYVWLSSAFAVSRSLGECRIGVSREIGQDRTTY